MDVDLEIGMMILGAEATDIGKRQHPVRFGRIRCLFLSLLAPASLDMPRHDYSRCSMWVRSMSIIADMSFSSLVFIFMSPTGRSEEHTSELQSLMRISYAVFCLQKKNQ